MILPVKAHRKAVKTSNHVYTTLLLHREEYRKGIWLSSCLMPLRAVLGSQGIVVKCASAIFLDTIDSFDKLDHPQFLSFLH